MGVLDSSSGLGAATNLRRVVVNANRANHQSGVQALQYQCQWGTLHGLHAH